MNAVERVKKICKERKIPISHIERDLGFANGYIGQLKKGSFPSDRLLKIAEYLQVDPEYLMTGQKESTRPSSTSSAPELTDRDRKDIEKDVINIMEKLTSGEDGPASYGGEPLSPESAELFREELEIALKRLKIINKEKYNPYKNKK